MGKGDGKPAVDLSSFILPFCISCCCLFKAACLVPSVAEMQVFLRRAMCLESMLFPEWALPG